MLDSCWTRWTPGGCFLVRELSILTKVGLVLDSCWTHVGLALDYVWPIICTVFGVVLSVHVGLMLDSCWTRWTPALVFVQKLRDGGKQPVWNFKILKGQRSRSPGLVQLFRAASPTFPGRPRKPKGSRLRRNIVLGALLLNGVRPQ